MTMTNEDTNTNGRATTANTDMVLSRDDRFRRELEPHTMDGVYTMAEQIASVGLCGVKNPQEALVRILTGRELGLSLMQSMRGVYVVEGNPSLSASLKQSICLAHPEVCEEFRMIESTNEKCTYRVKRRGEPSQEVTWTLEDAERAQLLNRGDTPEKKKMSNWSRYPRRMLQARAKSEAADIAFGDLLHGFPTQEEMVDEREARGGPAVVEAPIPVEVVSSKVRDLPAELAALKSQIDAISSKETGTAARKAIETWDAPESFAKQAMAHYDARVAAAKEAAKKKAAPAQAAPAATQAAQPAPAAAATPTAPASQPAMREPGQEG